MKVLVFPDEKKRIILRLTPETEHEGFSLGLAWAEYRNEVCMKRSNVKFGELEFVLQGGKEEART